MNKGFTLIELLVVVVIIGCLAAAGLPYLMGGKLPTVEMIDGHQVKAVGECRYIEIGGQWVPYNPDVKNAN